MNRKKTAAAERQAPSRSAWPLWFRALGSVWCAAFLLGTLAVILIASTTIESKLGTPHAQRLVYQSRWFDLFLALLGLNIAASTVLRWPFKKKHTGFIVTHIGILLLLAGSLLSRLASTEGQMLLYEGERAANIASDSFEIFIGHGRGAGRSYPLETLRKEQVLTTFEDGAEMVFADFKENALLETSVEDGGGEPNPALRIKLSSEMAGFSQPFWLVLRDPSDPDSARKMLGPAMLELKSGEPPEEGEGQRVKGEGAPKVVFHRGGNILAEIPLDPVPSQPIAVGKTGYRLRNVRYWPDARVDENNKLISVSDKPLNPAVEAELASPAGDIVRLVRFTHFPNFESLHGKAGAARPDFDVELVVNNVETQNIASLRFYSGGPWQYRFHSLKGKSTGGPIEEGKTYPAGWMDFQFSVERLIERARVRRAVREIAGPKGQPAVSVQLRKDGRSAGEAWILPDTPAPGPDGRPLPVRLRQKTLAVPFELRLKDFRKVDYPGTARAASFESDVTLEDPAEGFSLSRTIRMNKPLDYKGFRIFQSSFVEDTGSGEASVFTVAKNPGIRWIYSGAVILFVGAFVTFFIPPFSSLAAFKN